MLIDAHTHINFSPLLEDWQTHLQDFQNTGGKYLINAGAHQDYNENGILIAKEAKKLFPELIVKATVGIHPDDTKEIKKTETQFMIDLLHSQAISNPDIVVAIGECGIDLHGDDSVPLAHQQEIFYKHCELAKKLNLPLVIHSRAGFQETLDVLKDFTDLKIYFHCRGYGANEISILESVFPKLWIGFTNIITYKNAQSTRDSLLAIKKAKILTETDAPWLPPQAFRGQTNYPHYVRYVVDKIAEMLGQTAIDIEVLVEKNLKDLFPLEN